MKLLHAYPLQAYCHVASRGEAWIETLIAFACSTCAFVASRGEAWIETFLTTPFYAILNVASRGEAWIETSGPHTLHSNGLNVSPPVGRRGLKLFYLYVLEPILVSPPVGRRGLKRTWAKRLDGNGIVASRGEAWIETNLLIPFFCCLLSRLPWGGVD